MQVFYRKFQIYLRILLKMACYPHKRATVLSMVQKRARLYPTLNDEKKDIFTFIKTRANLKIDANGYA